MKSGELFAGVGGFGMAIDEVFGTEPAWFCEFDAAPSKVLAHHYPGIPNFGDVRNVKWTPDCPTCGEATGLLWRRDELAGPVRKEYHCREHGWFPLDIRFADRDASRIPDPIDLLGGGFPCQDVSLAGRRRGMRNGTRSGLWTEFAKAIDALRPDWVVIENVRGLLTADGEPPHDALVTAIDEIARLDRLARMAERFINENPANRREGRSPHVIEWRRAAVRIARLRKRAVRVRDRERGLVRRAIDTVLRDLADLGFDAEWTGLRAADVGAPHGRFRVFILAWPKERTAPDHDRGGLESLGRLGQPVERDLDGRDGAGPTSGKLTLLPTPIVSDGTGGSKNIQASDFAPQMRDIVKLLPTPTASEGEHGGPGRTYGNGSPTLGGIRTLLPTPDAYAGSRGGSQHPEKRRGGGHTVSLSDVTEHALLPTPVTQPETGNGHARDLGSEMKLLPTPVAQPSGNSPEDHLRKKPGREVVTDLAIIAENGLIPTGGRLLPTPSVSNSHGNEANGRGEALLPGVVNLLPTPTVALADGGQTSRSGDRKGEMLLGGIAAEAATGTDWGTYATAIRIWEQTIGRPAPAPVRPDGKGGKPRLNPELTEWMMGWPLGWVTAAVIGLTRAEQLKACGNGVVPRQAAAALLSMLARPGVPRSALGLAA